MTAFVATHRESIEGLVDRVAWILPEQGPLQTLPQHNTLGMLEHLPFDQAVRCAAEALGAQAYLPETAFHDHLRAGRITPDDLDAVIDAEIPDDGYSPLPGGPSRREFLRRRLRTLIPPTDNESLRWSLAETDLITRVDEQVDAHRRRELLAAGGSEAEVISTLWGRLARVADPRVARARWMRPRDALLARSGQDTDQLTHPVLIRFTAAYLDQGVAEWSMPGREKGMLVAFRELHARDSPRRFLRGLAEETRRQRGWDAERTIRWALTEMGVRESEYEPVIQDSLRALRGWAGMVRQFEHHPDRAPVIALRTRLVDFLAVRLILDVFASRSVTGGGRSRRQDPEPDPGPDLTAVHEAFVLAQVMPVNIHLLADPDHARRWCGLVAECGEWERRRLLHLAFERRHQIEVLDGLLAHQRVARRAPRPDTQALFCVDEREESLRRHLEELFPTVETFGHPGSFGISMRYQGVDDPKPTSMGPGTPTPLVREEIVAPAPAPPSNGLPPLPDGPRSLLGFLGRCVLPHTTHTLFGSMPALGPVTRLTLERRGPDEPGFTVFEMIDIVARVLLSTGIARDPAPLILVVGHGSSSVNNPHESAYDCGAAGGRGGPSARVFAAMANHPLVRAGLRDLGITIPDDTWFVGAHHNTCDDSFTYLDTHLVPSPLRPALRELLRRVRSACARAAHERCRRFGTAPTTLSARRALDHVRARAADPGQSRPEYGHAGNAVCVIGRRELTRGLYLDRRAFLVSYDPDLDRGDRLLTDLLLAAGPMCSGINLEYYFSTVDPAVHGAGSKLPHNIVGLIGVMDGHGSDLRTGLSTQSVEIHEPVRLLMIVEAGPERLTAIVAAHPSLRRLVTNGWLRLVSWRPDLNRMWTHTGGRLRPYEHDPHRSFPVMPSSVDFYAGRSGHLGCAHIGGDR